ncbi:beta-lactamase superfamily domain-containing protein [Fennellomyces sp. T-0311]|nr:beta-lactamase superfamily domain-containing protein [Fennellomyces sp. T-0311]
MSKNPTFKLTMTHISTATAILDIDGVRLLTDPVFDAGGSEYDIGPTVLKKSKGPAIKRDELPPIDGILLSHEDHEDNLDTAGRQLLDGRKIFTTMDGAKNLQPRPGVKGLEPWETVSAELGGKTFKITGTPCKHVPGGQVTGFILTSESFGTTDGKPNAIYFAGDTVYIPELADIRNKFHVSVAIFNLGEAYAPLPEGPLQITMGGKDAAKLARDIDADIVVPIHYEDWQHFTQFGDALRKDFEEAGLMDKVCWLTPGVPKRVI